MQPNPLPQFFFPNPSAYALVPINGHGNETATAMLRVLAEKRALSDMPKSHIARLVKHAGGTTTQRSLRSGHFLIQYTFPDGSALLAAGDTQEDRTNGLMVTLYPQPLFCIGNTHPIIGLKNLDTSVVMDIWDAITACSSTAISTMAMQFSSMHWPTWASITQPNGSINALAQTLELFLTLFQPPTQFPVPRFGNPGTPTVPVLVSGRKYSLTGPGPIQVQVDPTLRDLNPGWADPLEAAMTRLLDSSLFNPYTQISQTLKEAQPNEKKIVSAPLATPSLRLLHTTLSAHDRLSFAATLPAGVLAA